MKKRIKKKYKKRSSFKGRIKYFDIFQEKFIRELNIPRSWFYPINFEEYMKQVYITMDTME